MNQSFSQNRNESRRISCAIFEVVLKENFSARAANIGVTSNRQIIFAEEARKLRFFVAIQIVNDAYSWSKLIFYVNEAIATSIFIIEIFISKAGVYGQPIIDYPRVLKINALVYDVERTDVRELSNTNTSLLRRANKASTAAVGISRIESEVSAARVLLGLRSS